MYYRKLCGNDIFLSPIDLENEYRILTQWVNEDDSIKNGNGFFAKILDENKIKEFLTTWNEGPCMFSIVTNDNEFVGHITLFNFHQTNYATLGIYIGPYYRNLGYGSQAMHLLLDYAFNQLNLHSIHLDVYEFNQDALRLYQSMGFTICGNYTDAIYHNGKYWSIILMELLKKDYLKERKD